jgi:phosphoglycolate phosphatase
MKNLDKKKLLIFDLDGVIFDSKRNMRLAWNETSKKFDLNIPFSLYFKKIGLPFIEILKSLGIRPKNEIYQCFKSTSLKRIDLIKPYKGVIKQIKILKKNKIKFSIVTSKDLKRTKFLLKKYNIQPNTIHCPNNKLRGKPYPDHLLNSLKKNKVKPKEACYFGDAEVDYLAAKKAKIDFVFARYGYGKKKSYYRYQIRNFSQIMQKKYFNII